MIMTIMGEKKETRFIMTHTHTHAHPRRTRMEENRSHRTNVELFIDPEKTITKAESKPSIGGSHTSTDRARLSWSGPL